MSDIVERLLYTDERYHKLAHVKLHKDSADEITRLRSELANARNAALEEAAKLAENFHWVLPMYEKAELNEASDDAACDVAAQIAAAIGALKAEGESR